MVQNYENVQPVSGKGKKSKKSKSDTTRSHHSSKSEKAPTNDYLKMSAMPKKAKKKDVAKDVSEKKRSAPSRVGGGTEINRAQPTRSGRSTSVAQSTVAGRGTTVAASTVVGDRSAMLHKVANAKSGKSKKSGKSGGKGGGGKRKERIRARIQNFKGKKSTKWLLLGTALICLLLIVGVVAIIVYLLLFDEVKETNRLPNMQVFCQKKYGTCSYYKQKYVTNCDVENCSFVSVQPDFNECEIGSITRVKGAKFVFRLINDATIPVPHHMPCWIDQKNNKSGLCVDKVCKSVEDKRLLNFAKRKPVDGGWQVNRSKPFCIQNFSDKAISIDWAKYYDKVNCRINRTICDKFAIRFRTCTNPIPKYGGKLCWAVGDANSTISLHDWPIEVVKPCPHCKRIKNYQLNAATSCSTHSRDDCLNSIHGVVDGLVETDFDPCCPGNTTSVGRCLLGNCLNVPF